jgi:hypothetical protein
MALEEAKLKSIPATNEEKRERLLQFVLRNRLLANNKTTRGMSQSLLLTPVESVPF